MPIDPDRLLRFAIPRGRQRLTPRDAAFYALSIGIGQEPTDPAQLRFVDPLPDMLAVPSMALVLAHPGFWLAHPDSGVDPLGVLHGGQSFDLTGPLPVDGEIESVTRVTGLVDKGPGKAGLIYSETELLDAGSGASLGKLERTTFIRGGGGFGGDWGEAARPAPMPQPDSAPDLTIDLATRPEQALFYRLNGDLNPLHSDPAVATKAGFARPVLHGLCTMGVIVHALLRGAFAYDPAPLRSASLRFAAPVLPGETIRTEIWRDGFFRARAVERDVIVADTGRFAARAIAEPETTA